MRYKLFDFVSFLFSFCLSLVCLCSTHDGALTRGPGKQDLFKFYSCLIDCQMMPVKTYLYLYCKVIKNILYDKSFWRVFFKKVKKIHFFSFPRRIMVAGVSVSGH